MFFLLSHFYYYFLFFIYLILIIPLGIRFPFSLYGFRNVKITDEDSIKDIFNKLIEEQEAFEKSKEAESELENIGKLKLKDEIEKLSAIFPKRRGIIKEVSLRKCKDNHHLPKEIIEQISSFINSGKIDNLERKDVRNFIFYLNLLFFQLNVLFEWIDLKLNDPKGKHKLLEDILEELEELNKNPKIEEPPASTEVIEKKKAGRKSEEKFVPSDALKKKVILF